MKKILFLITKSEIGGAQKWVKEQMEICDKNFACYLATNRPGWLSKHVKHNKLFFDSLIESRFSIKYLWLLNKHVRDNKFDIIVASSANAGIYSRLLKLLNGKKVKVIYVTHGWSAIYNGGFFKYLYIGIEKFLAWCGDSILCISVHDYQTAVNVIGIRENKLRLISNSIFPLDRVRKKTAHKKIKMLTVARLSPPKRMDLLVNAVKNIDVELHIVGDGELREDLERAAPDNVFFHGEIECFSNFLDFDIFCLISDSEGLPLSAIEAMSCGMPLILSNVGGCSELISGNGILVENNTEDIESAISQSSDQIKTYGRRSKTLFKNRFNLEKNKHKYLSYYHKI
jgi:glycosyltransferase involved in cell wall biosynthesis